MGPKFSTFMNTNPFAMRHVNRFPLLIPTLTLLLSGPVLFAQSDETRIRAVREASNQALKAYDTTAELSFLTEDVLITTGNGTLLAGKEALRNYIGALGESKMYWVRTPDHIEVHEANGLAWETGTWKGYDPERGEAAVVGGRYAAQWTRASGTWKIKSELFVALE